MPSLFKEFEYLDYQFPQPQYLGSKYRFRSWIGSFLPRDAKTIVDAFGGSQSMAYYFKQLGYSVYTNDLMAYSNAIGKALIENRNEVLDAQDLKNLLSDNPDKNVFDLMGNTFTDVFFKEEDTAFLDAIRGNIERLATPYKKYLALSIINRAMTRKVTMGHFAHTQALSYAADPERVKRNRSLVRPVKELFLSLLDGYNAAVFDNRTVCTSERGDAIGFLSRIPGADVAYFDPPYGNSHADYQQFYHLLETYTMYWKDKKFVNGTRRYEPKRETFFDQKATIVDGLNRLFCQADRIPHWIISYNDRSYPDVEALKDMVSKYRRVHVERKLYNECRGGKGSVAGSSEILIIGEPK